MLARGRFSNRVKSGVYWNSPAVIQLKNNRIVFILVKIQRNIYTVHVVYGEPKIDDLIVVIASFSTDKVDRRGNGHSSTSLDARDLIRHVTGRRPTACRNLSSGPSYVCGRRSLTDSRCDRLIRACRQGHRSSWNIHKTHCTPTC